MKPFKMTLAIAASFLVIGGIMFNLLDKERYYIKRSSFRNFQAEGIKGAWEYYHLIRQNPETGRVDDEDVLRARDDAQSMATRSSGGLKWTEMGPDNVGGRTRALLIDPRNPNRMYAGGVSGGLWFSDNAGGLWQQVANGDFWDNLAVTSICMAANGDIYVGTGEGIYYFDSGNGTGGLIGNGIYKSTDGGKSFNHLPSTRPVGNQWTSVSQLVAHPTNPNLIYAGTIIGLRVSEDGGQTWQSNYIPLSSPVKDIEMHKDGTTLVAYSSAVWISNTGQAGTFTNTATSARGMHLVGVTRVETAIAPSNSNVIYAAAARSNGTLFNLYYTENKGETWHIVVPGGAAALAGLGGQGDFNNIVSVNPYDEGEALVGFVTLWRFKRVHRDPPSGSFEQIAHNFAPLASNVYVHSDLHNIQWHPDPKNRQDSSTWYIATDGGIFRTLDNGTTYRPMSRNFNTVQVYGIGFSGTGQVLLGTQDNGTKFIPRLSKSNSYQMALDAGGGDGGYSEISQINPNIHFSTIYWGICSMNTDPLNQTRGTSVYSGPILNHLNIGVPGTASFVTPIRLWESFNDENSLDSVNFANNLLSETIGMGNNIVSQFSGVLKRPQASAKFVPGTFKINTTSGVSLNDVQNIDDPTRGYLVGNGLNPNVASTINYETGAITVALAKAPNTGVAILASYYVRYNSGDEITVNSRTANYPFNYTLNRNLEPADSIKIYDKIQARFVVGFNGSVWLNKRILEGGTNAWVRLANVNGIVQNMCFTNDGNTLWVGTQTGHVHRIEGLKNITDAHIATSATVNNPISVVTNTHIGSFNRFITDISVHPKNDDKVLVTLGGYGPGNNIRICNNATTATAISNFTSIHNNLPSFPVYTAIFQKDDISGDKIIAGAEYGIYISENGGNSWDKDPNIGNLPVFMLRQQTHANNFYRGIYNDGHIYAGTHGRGVFYSDTYAGPVSVENIKPQERIKKSQSEISVFPNPVRDNSTITFETTKPFENGSVAIFDINGKVVKSISLPNLSVGKQVVNFSAQDFSLGTYFVKVNAGDVYKTAKIVVVR
jgi:hypothetical protein